MRYVKPRTYRLNPRRELTVLDRVVMHYATHRFTFTEPEALQAMWVTGEEVRLREDPRFWEIADLAHFHLADHQLANGELGDRLWQGIWDGRDVDVALEALDQARPGSFHVFCAAEPIFILAAGAYQLGAHARLRVPEEAAKTFEAAREALLNEHLITAVPRTSPGMLDWLVRFAEPFEADHDTLDLLEAWLDARGEWTEVGRGLWLPSSLVPLSPTPVTMRVRPIYAGASEPHGGATTGNGAQSDSEQIEGAASTDPPVARDNDAAVSWTQALRAVHLQGGFVPVPASARFRYPRFIGRSGPLALRAIVHETGEEGYLWLDRDRNLLFGELLAALIEWDEAGRRLHVRWAVEAIVLRFGEIDLEVQAEESRLIDLESLHGLRLELGESYRASLAEILRSAGPLPFQRLYEALVGRVGHRPPRDSIRSVLSVCPEFRVHGHAWEWQPAAGSKRALRRAVVLSKLGLDPRGKSVNISRLAEAALQRAVQIGAPTQPTRSPPTDRSL